MDEVQSWWEVPAIAHFCYVFRAAFNLFYIEIGELEAAILNIQDPEMCTSLEQLVIRLLQGCYDENEVMSNNWEEKLHELFNENCEDEENPLENNAFAFLSSRSKVEVLLKLCEFRLDVDGALDAIKDIPPEDMQARCVGKDGQNNSYWYFYDERLYKEDPSGAAKKPKKLQQQSGKKNIKDSNVKNGKRGVRDRKTKTEEQNTSWSIVCHNSSDWEILAKNFVKSKHKAEKELAKEIKNVYLPKLAEVVAEKDRLLRKRFLELAPKRASSRLSKVQAQKKLEEQMAAEANEKRRLEMEEEQIQKEADRKKQIIEDRRKRAEAREKIIEERSRRALQRDMMRGLDVPEDDFDLDPPDTRANRRVKKLPAYKETSDNSDEENSEEEESSDDNASHSESDDGPCEDEEHSSNISNNESEEDDNSDDNFENSASGNIIPKGTIEKNNFVNSSTIQNSHGVSKWKDDVHSKIHILHYSSNGSNKRMKIREGSYKIDSETQVPTKATDLKPNYYNDTPAYHPLLHRNLNSCSKVTSSPPIIRIGYIKPSTNH
ncbi:cat eye syndrome critical region protein 2 [Caerostris darwini]|uniref:Cat eye syndrome critical region protein 2 n=1 Tax=Caerostris darwini TaxID=1538125 RepID=A0AAV4VYI9_9ARAC|nr:cat eye syndrome critical region protein 2 [Caerostris darwini]